MNKHTINAKKRGAAKPGADKFMMMIFHWSLPSWQRIQREERRGRRMDPFLGQTPPGDRSWRLFINAALAYDNAKQCFCLCLWLLKSLNSCSLLSDEKYENHHQHQHNHFNKHNEFRVLQFNPCVIHVFKGNAQDHEYEYEFASELWFTI